MEKKFVAVGREMYTVEDGKVVITSEELANAIQNEQVDIFLDEEESGLFGDCFNGKCDCSGEEIVQKF